MCFVNNWIIGNASNHERQRLWDIWFDHRKFTQQLFLWIKTLNKQLWATLNKQLWATLNKQKKSFSVVTWVTCAHVKSWPLNKGKLKISFMFTSVFVFDTMFVILFDAIFVLCWPLWGSKVECASRIGEPRTSNPPYHLPPKIIYMLYWKMDSDHLH